MNVIGWYTDCLSIMEGFSLVRK